MKKLLMNPSAILGSLLVLDAALALIAFFAPEFWFQLFHGVAYNDPEGLLRRAAGGWTAFALVQIIALRSWRKNRDWLLIAAGLRFGDMFTDWTYLAFAQHMTPLGWAMLAVASPGNVFLGFALVRAARRYN